MPERAVLKLAICCNGSNPLEVSEYWTMSEPFAVRTWSVPMRRAAPRAPLGLWQQKSLSSTLCPEVSMILSLSKSSLNNSRSVPSFVIAPMSSKRLMLLLRLNVETRDPSVALTLYTLTDWPKFWSDSLDTMYRWPPR